MACDIALSHISERQELYIPSIQLLEEPRKIPTFKYPLAAICLYMGGITGLQMGKTLGIDKLTLPSIKDLLPLFEHNYIISKPLLEEGPKTPDILIITATNEPQIFSCLHAFLCFYDLGYNVRLVNMPERKHEFYPDSIPEIWDFFVNSPHPRMK